jgi:hypothetical protein
MEDVISHGATVGESTCFMAIELLECPIEQLGALFGQARSPCGRQDRPLTIEISTAPCRTPAPAHLPRC